ncbi:MAG: hypothetical protein OXS29_12370 [bacterium]|nr:hypothetical protein [bacterium]
MTGPVTEGYVEAQAARMKAETYAQWMEAVQRSERAAFHRTMWLAALILAGIASATGVVIAVLK